MATTSAVGIAVMGPMLVRHRRQRNAEAPGQGDPRRGGAAAARARQMPGTPAPRLGTPNDDDSREAAEAGEACMRRLATTQQTVRCPLDDCSASLTVSTDAGA